MAEKIVYGFVFGIGFLLPVLAIIFVLHPNTYKQMPSAHELIVILSSTVLPLLCFIPAFYWTRHEPKGKIARKCVWCFIVLLIAYWVFFSWTAITITKRGCFSGATCGRNVYGIYLGD